MKTLGRFVLIDNSSKKQMFLQWKTHAALNRPAHKNNNIPMAYSTRKNIISQLKPLDLNEKATSNAKKTNHTTVRASTSSKNLSPFFYANPERENTAQSKAEFNTFYRTRSLGKLSRQSTFTPVKNKINTDRLKYVIAQAEKKKGRVISVLKMRRQGLRFKTGHDFFTVSKQNGHENLIKQIKQQMFEEFLNMPDKKVYLFHLGKEPINNILLNLDSKEYVIFADINPKFAIPFEFQMKLFQQASIIEEEIKSHLLQFEEFRKEFQEQQQVTEEEGDAVYEWQKIKDVKNYVDKLVDNPAEAKNLKKQKTEKDEIDVWCSERYTPDEQKKGDKNPFFDVQSHFPKESTQVDTLIQAAVKIDFLPTTINKHEVKQRPVENMMEKIKRQNEDADLLKKQQTEKIKTLGYKSQKQFLKELDEKNVPLAYQNIPYMMEKYGINRAEAYNLYNLYKTLEKISAMRLFESNQYRRVKQKGIDRKTFDEGLKGLEINPGDQVIRNICYFPQFITWEQFIKIISISLRKTPKSKLEAILQGLGSTDAGFLTVDQIGIMVGSSLQKIFGRDQPELRKYFTSVVMKTLDKDKNGTIEIEQLKQHVLEKGVETLDLVSYLMLNS